MKTTPLRLVTGSQNDRPRDSRCFGRVTRRPGCPRLAVEALEQRTVLSAASAVSFAAWHGKYSPCETMEESYEFAQTSSYASSNAEQCAPTRCDTQTYSETKESNCETEETYCETEENECETEETYCETEQTTCEKEESNCETEETYCETEQTYCESEESNCETEEDYCETDSYRETEENDCEADKTNCETNETYCRSEATYCESNATSCQNGDSRASAKSRCETQVSCEETEYSQSCDKNRWQKESDSCESKQDAHQTERTWSFQMRSSAKKNEQRCNENSDRVEASSSKRNGASSKQAECQVVDRCYSDESWIRSLSRARM